MRRLSTDVAHVDVAGVHLEDVAEADRELGEGGSEVEQREAVLLERFVGFLLVVGQVDVVAGDFAEIGQQRVEQVARNVVHRDRPRVGGPRVTDEEALQHRQIPDAAQFERLADLVDVDADAATVAHPDQHRRHGAKQGHGAAAEHAVGVGRVCVAQLAHQQLADRIGIAGREWVEGVGLTVRCTAARHTRQACREKVEHEHIVLAAEAAGEGEDLAIEFVAGLAVHEHEATAVRQGVGQKTDDGGGLASPGGAWNGAVLATILVGEPQLLAGDLIVADEDIAGGLPRLAGRGIGQVPVTAACAARKAHGRVVVTRQHPGGEQSAAERQGCG